MSKPRSPVRDNLRRRAALAAALLAAIALPAYAGDIVGAARVVDGDTIDVAGQRIRIAAVDAPERTQSCRRDGKDWPCGRIAAQTLETMLAGRTVICVDSGQRSHRRIVAVCDLDGRDIGGELVALGWAREIRRYSKGRYTAAETQARQQLRGAWAGGPAGFEDPAAFRKRR